MKENTRRALVLLALIGTVAAAVFAPAPEEEVAEPTPRARATSPQPHAAKAVADDHSSVPEMQARQVSSDTPSIFEKRSWRKAVVPVAASKPAVADPIVESPPQAPAAPFRILGRVVEDGVAGVFVQHNDRTLILRTGDTVDDVYRVESISDQSITVMYLPMNVPQTILTGAVN